jgi:hypothetical protein
MFIYNMNREKKLGKKQVALNSYKNANDMNSSYKL